MMLITLTVDGWCVQPVSYSFVSQALIKPEFTCPECLYRHTSSCKLQAKQPGQGATWPELNLSKSLQHTAGLDAAQSSCRQFPAINHHHGMIAEVWQRSNDGKTRQLRKTNAH
jgi:hypothetical protein